MRRNRKRDPFRVMTPQLKWKEALEDLIDDAAEEGVLFSQPEIECSCIGFHSAPDVEIRSLTQIGTEFVDIND